VTRDSNFDKYRPNYETIILNTCWKRGKRETAHKTRVECGTKKREVKNQLMQVDTEQSLS
jgi:hypothetical protein